jgi:hypothetical protein
VQFLIFRWILGRFGSPSPVQFCGSLIYGTPPAKLSWPTLIFPPSISGTIGYFVRGWFFVLNRQHVTSPSVGQGRSPRSVVEVHN